MRRFLSSFFLSWTSTITVTLFYFSRHLFKGKHTGAAMTGAAIVGFTILFIAAIYNIIHHKWVRPRGYMLVREDVLARLVANYDEEKG